MTPSSFPADDGLLDYYAGRDNTKQRGERDITLIRKQAA